MSVKYFYAAIAAIFLIYIFIIKSVNKIGDHMNPINYLEATSKPESREKTFTIFEYYILGFNLEGKTPQKQAKEKVRGII